MQDARYTNQGATRDRKVKQPLFEALDKISKEFGLDFEIYSGGQAPKGTKGKRVGTTTNHDDSGDGGGAADVRFKKDGKSYDLESDPKIKEALVRRLKEEGINQIGYGKGYMKGTTSAHLGMDNSGVMKVWGADKTRGTADPAISRTVGQSIEKMRIPKNNYMPIRPQTMAGTMVDAPFVDNKGTQLAVKPTKTVPVQGADYEPMQVIQTKQTGNNPKPANKELSLGDTVPYLSNLYNLSQK